MTELERVLEKYLLGDLRKLANVDVGYPTLMTVCAGAELLGSLLTDDEDLPGGTRKKTDFTRFWMTYLYPDRPRAEEEANILYELVRHGTMHHFFPKGMIDVTGGGSPNHFRIDPDRGLLLDVNLLVERFLAAYYDRVRPVLTRSTGMPNRESARRRFDSIRAAGERAAREFDPRSVFPPFVAIVGIPAQETTAIAALAIKFNNGPTGLR